MANFGTQNNQGPGPSGGQGGTGANGIFMRTLANKYGTGISARADANGNHSIAAGLVDAYAQAGQSVPTHLLPAIQELNELTQQDVALSQTSASARMAFGGTGYDPLKARGRVSELEQFILSESAEARNLGARTEQRLNEERLATLELQTRKTAAT